VLSIRNKTNRPIELVGESVVRIPPRSEVILESYVDVHGQLESLKTRGDVEVESAIDQPTITSNEE
jgi:hypothetical protein